MGKTNDKRLTIFIRNVQKALDPSLILLFGSRARGDFLEESDYDVIVVAESFKGIHFPSRGAEVLKYHPGGISLEVLCFTPEEFEIERRSFSVAAVAEKEGKVLLKKETIRV
jgi:predicted nucleotidyltransferase